MLLESPIFQHLNTLSVAVSSPLPQEVIMSIQKLQDWLNCAKQLQKKPSRFIPKVSESQILITNGCKQAVYMACQTILDPNDEVILPTPYWTTYPESIRAAGAKVVIPATDSFYVTVDQLQSVLTNKTKAIILSSPSNPSGAVYSLDSLRDIARFAKNTVYGLFLMRFIKISIIREGWHRDLERLFPR